MSTIFIGHSSKDNHSAQRIADHLALQGHKSVFLDFNPDAGIGAGMDWERELYAKLRQSQVVLAVVSPDWVASKWCFAEAIHAREKGKRLILVKVRETEIPDPLRTIQYIDLTRNEAQGLSILTAALADVFELKPGQ